jgi:hypothetical protein
MKSGAIATTAPTPVENVDPIPIRSLAVTYIALNGQAPNRSATSHAALRLTMQNAIAAFEEDIKGSSRRKLATSRR